MASKTTEFANALLNHIFNNVALANIGDAAGLPAGTAGNLYLSLHTADPGYTGDQTTSEIVYTGYQRIAVARNNASPKWTVLNRAAVNVDPATWPECTAGSGTVLVVGVGTASSGAGHLIYRAYVTVPSGGLEISTGITPNITASNLVFLEQ